MKENATTETALAVVPKFDQTLRQRLLDLRAGLNGADYSNNKMGKALGVNPSYVSQFCNGKEFAGDLDKFHSRLDDWFRNQARRKGCRVETIATDETKAISNSLETLRKMNEIGCIILPSGGGKTCGEELYLKENPTAIHMQVRQWARDKASVEQALLKSVDGKRDCHTKPADFLVQKLAGSNRLLIVGDAHKLTKTALQWLVDFWEETRMSIALVGTQELQELLMSDAQRFSRIMLWDEIKPQEPRLLITHMAKSLLPDLNGELETVCDLGEQIVSHEGHYRAAYKQFKLAAEIKSRARKPITHEQAVRSAHTKLLRNWQLS